MSYMLSSGLLNKRDLQLAQLQRLSYRMDEIKYVKNIIEKDVQGEFGGVVDRLRNAEGQKIAILQNEMAQLQNEIEKIDGLVNEYNKVRDDAPEMMLRARAIKDNVDGLITKPFKRNIDVIPDDLPRELSDLRQLLARASSIKGLLKMRDTVIFQLHQDKKVSEKLAIDNFNTMASEEVNSWAKLTDKYAEDVKKFQLICFYCAEALTEENVNEPCLLNKNKELNSAFGGFTAKAPKDKYHGNLRHFFSEPGQEIFTSGLAFQNLQSMFSEEQTSMLKKGLMLQIGMFFC